MNPHLLVVDDDAGLRDLLSRYLTEAGFAVTVAESAGKARALMALVTFDLIVLDGMMPGETGLSFAKTLVDAPPILFLTAMGEAEDRIAGLEAGADDYLTKPFEPKELTLRIRRILARVGEQRAVSQSVRFGDFSYDIPTGRLSKNGEPVYLTAGEAALLKILAERVGEPISREELAEKAGIAGGNERTVDVQITRLRKKIEPGERPVYLQTVRNAGYVLVP